ncbi:MAG: tilS [Acidimicrobiia bacterium]|nr:tilS [Acidimicrobiia bacterium]
MALLVLAVEAGCVVTAVHVDHGLRPGSDSEAAGVRAACERFGAAFLAKTVVVPAGANLEARARAARYEVLPSDVLTGHTADDQAETVLLNLIRGAGLDGLAGMRSPRHPLLALRRRDTVGLCRQLEVPVFHDPSNDDPRWRRNRIRHEVLPLLAEVAERDVIAVVARQARLLAADADLLDALATSLDPTDAKALAAAPEPLARRALRRWLADPYPPDAEALERVMAVAHGRVKACELASGLRIERHGQRLSKRRP